ncbi:MAG: hypothetical protein ACTSO8_03105 [Promethearchaeota archaeon]
MQSKRKLTKASFSQLIIIVLGALLNFLFAKGDSIGFIFSFTVFLYILFKLVKDNRGFIRNEIGDYKGKWRDILWLNLPSMFYLFSMSFHFLLFLFYFFIFLSLVMRSLFVFKNSKQRYATVHIGENNHVKTVLEHTSGVINDGNVVKALIGRKMFLHQLSNMGYVLIYALSFAILRGLFGLLVILESDALIFSLIISLVEYLIFRSSNITLRSMNKKGKKKKLYDDLYDSHGAKKWHLILLMSYPIIFILSNLFIFIMIRNINVLNHLLNGTSWSEIGYENANLFQIIIYVFVQIPLNITYTLLILNNNVISYRLLIIKYGLKTQPKKNKYQQVAFACIAYTFLQMGWWWAHLSNLFIIRDLITFITLSFSIVYLILIRKTKSHRENKRSRFILSIVIQNGSIIALIWIMFPYLTLKFHEVYIPYLILFGIIIFLNFVPMYPYFVFRNSLLAKETNLDFKETVSGNLVYLANSKIFREDNSTCYKLLTLALEYKNSHEMILTTDQEVDLIYYLAKYANLLEKNAEFEIQKKKLESFGKLGAERIKHLEKGREWLLKDNLLGITLLIVVIVMAIMLMLW